MHGAPATDLGTTVHFAASAHLDTPVQVEPRAAASYVHPSDWMRSPESRGWYSLQPWWLSPLALGPFGVFVGCADGVLGEKHPCCHHHQARLSSVSIALTFYSAEIRDPVPRERSSPIFYSPPMLVMKKTLLFTASLRGMKK